MAASIPRPPYPRPHPGGSGEHAIAARRHGGLLAASAGDRQSAPADMEAVLSQALLLTDKQMTERGASVTHDPLPAVTGDFEILTKVLHI